MMRRGGGAGGRKGEAWCLQSCFTLQPPALRISDAPDEFVEDEYFPLDILRSGAITGFDIGARSSPQRAATLLVRGKIGWPMFWH